MLRFGYPDSLIREYEHWVVLLRPAQVTLGSLILAAKGDATAFGQLPPGAHAELATVTKDLEATLLTGLGYEKINYLMLMMVDPHVHFHVLPRYSGSKSFNGLDFSDAGWPGQPDLKSAIELTPEDNEQLRNRISQTWLIEN
ncbi:HIT family protein [Sphingomonas sp. NSE70-1]|uniref:HIT family protein n=1 Tax=Sphingomonas caseinilyticus TaxID=2908205 RepID=A0ABT0RRX2_9SPHN|nr:HIT family protein [Sphingomonas caseinilyticus]MCL6697425.1 HIT family protein [Sphingomonas caseinilyticus]